MAHDFEYLLQLQAGKDTYEMWKAAADYCHREDVFRWFRERAEAGDHPSQHVLYVLYRVRDDKDKYESESFFWCKKAAEGGIIPAQKDLSYFYKLGIGTEQNMERAAFWLQVAAAAGDAKALCALGMAYNGGRDGLERDHDKAMECYYWAAIRGNTLARLWIGQAYLEGDVFPQDEEEAMKFLRASANDGLDVAAYVAAIYYRKKGDSNRAMEWYRKFLEIARNDPDDPMNLEGLEDDCLDAKAESFAYSSDEEDEIAMQEYQNEQEYYDEEEGEEE